MKKTRSTRRAEAWTPQELAVLSPLSSPAKIQEFLDSLPYSSEPVYRCPRSVIRDRQAHCYDGALFAAAALRRLGHPPVIVNMLAERDDEHLVALYQVDGHLGAVAKSNVVGLRFREPVYRSLRELLMSYFEDYFNVEGLRSLRSYLLPLNLDTLGGLPWMTVDAAMNVIAEKLNRRRKVPLITPAMVARLAPVDRRSYESGFMGSDDAGLYKPGPKS